MSIAEALLPEFDHETSTTRNLLKIVPFEHKDWKPHVKSMSMLQLATHVAQVPSWTAPTLEEPELDVGPNSPNAKKYAPPLINNSEELLAYFDENVRKARQSLQAASDSTFREMWSLKSGDHTVFSFPKAAVMRSFVMNHLIHHRGQLSVYLRLKDVKLPEIYGPTADSK